VSYSEHEMRDFNANLSISWGKKKKKEKRKMGFWAEHYQIQIKHKKGESKRPKLN
jgi:hypothetical protein